MKFPTELYHYSNVHVEKLCKEFDRKYRESPHFDPYHKPCGIWFSVEDYEDDMTWEKWCRGEDFRVDHLNFRHKIVLKSDSNIVFLTNTSEIRRFGYQYSYNDPFEFGRRSVFGKNNPYIHGIRWDKLEKLYDGIIIAPYNWECRMPSETMWYYGWDCASGCIWNFDCIESFECINQMAATNEVG